MNITILGSAGQIGAYLSDYLKDKGHNVTDVDIVNGVQYDLRVTPSTIIEKAIESADFVFFLAFVCPLIVKGMLMLKECRVGNEYGKRF